jgi:hypothetical protein
MKAYKRGNKFSHLVNIADAAVDWAGLGADEWPRIYIDDDNLPMHLDSVGLLERAQGIVEAARRGRITGYTHNEDGHLLSVESIKLHRESVMKWTDSISRP